MKTSYGRIETYMPLPFDGVKRPYVPVRLQSGGKFFDTYGLIDSGADNTVFHVDLASLLGLVLSPGSSVQTTGTGGRTDVWYVNIRISVCGARFPATVGFSAGCPRDFGLLGRADFFHAFRVGFEHRMPRVLLCEEP